MITVVLVLARTLHIGGAMMLFALPFFMLVILRSAFSADSLGNYQSFCQKLTKWLWAVLILEAISGGVWFWFVSVQMNDLSPWSILAPTDLSTVLWQTHFGQLWLWRAVMEVALGVVLYFVSRRNTMTSPRLSFLNWLMLALSGCLLITLACAGHVATGTRYPALHLFADTVHLLVGAIWPMGLIPLATFVWQIDQRDKALPTDVEIKVLRRFSQISLIAVLILTATGVINGWLMVGSLEALASTTYGRLLLAKVLVVGIMIGLGAVNRLYLLPRTQDAPMVFKALRKTVSVECCLVGVVLLIVGIMGLTSPRS